MKITKSELKEIIREEFKKLNNESVYMTPSSLDKTMKDLRLNKIPIPSKGEQILKGMVKDKFIDRLTNVERLVYLVQSMGDRVYKFRTEKKPIAMLIDKLWNEISSETVSFNGKIAAYSVAMDIRDRMRNKEELDTPYEMLKEYFKNFGMEYSGSRIFDTAYKSLTDWMKRNKINGN